MLFSDISIVDENFEVQEHKYVATVGRKIAYIGDLGDGTGDTDGDGLTDWEEVKRYHTDPHLADTDCDGVGDGDEVQNGTDPLNPDTDGDGIWDGAEILKHKTNPLNPATNAPTTHADSADGSKEPAP